jgi:hypothetical protein
MTAKTASQAEQWKIISKLARDIAKTHEVPGESPGDPDMAFTMDCFKRQVAWLAGQARNTAP